jgi:poly-gamma-glutamate synthesis protein (capsule biosynthesis protein)
MDNTLYYRSKSIRYGKYFLLIILVFVILTSCKKENSEVRVLFVGDILLSRNVKEEFQTKKTFPWDNLKPLFQSSDLVAGNLEGAVGKIEDQLISDIESPVFNIDSTDIPMLEEAGFNIITIENNHSLDLSKKGKVNTIEALKKNNITPIYLENSPQFFTVKGVVISLLSLNIVLSRDSTKNQIPSIEIKQKLRLAKSLSNIVIVSIHWGSELLDWPDKEQRETAKWLIENGADIIIGSHPHIIQKPELINGKPVFFSLGNHLFDQKYPRTKDGLIVDIRIQNGKFSCFGIITHTKHNSFYPEISDSISYIFEPLPYRITPLQINNFTLKPLSIDVGDNNRIILQAFQKEKKVWETHPMSIISISSSKFDGKNEYLFTLENHYSSLDSETNQRPYVYSLDNKGLIARWRGSALAWPLIDAQISPENDNILCVLHRGDSFIKPDKTIKNTRVSAYVWNGFGFKGLSDSITCKLCEKLYNE